MFHSAIEPGQAHAVSASRATKLTLVASAGGQSRRTAALDDFSRRSAGREVIEEGPRRLRRRLIGTAILGDRRVCHAASAGAALPDRPAWRRPRCRRSARVQRGDRSGRGQRALARRVSQALVFLKREPPGLHLCADRRVRPFGRRRTASRPGPAAQRSVRLYGEAARLER